MAQELTRLRLFTIIPYFPTGLLNRNPIAYLMSAQRIFQNLTQLTPPRFWQPDLWHSKILHRGAGAGAVSNGQQGAIASTDGLESEQASDTSS
ncbi:MAG: hypothetical protein WCD18_17720 [Thermosynechococcaceae cyanobacterium]